MISGKSFADRCKWVYDPRYPGRPVFSYANASNGDSVFVNGDYLQQFRSMCSVFPRKQFLIIVHNTDRTFGPAELQALLPVSRHIYAINTTVRAPNLTTIPLGFVDRQLDFLSTLPPPTEERTIEIYSNFAVHTHAEKRNACRKAFETDPRVVVAENRTVPEYFADLQRSKFVLCPEGTGMDTHRVYEALLCGATPVVLRNSLSHLYERLPVCILNSWSDPISVPTSGTRMFNVAQFL
jgi:hypothetical protein